MRDIDAHAATVRSSPTGDPALQPAEALGDVRPEVVVDLMLACSCWNGADLVVLQPGEGVHDLSVKRGSVTLAKLGVDRDVADAAVARLALIAGLDPLLPSGSPEAKNSLARVDVVSGAVRSELLVSVAASVRGLEAEVRSLVRSEATPAVTRPLVRCTRCAAVQAAGSLRCALDGGELEPAVDNPSPGGLIGCWRLLARLGSGTTGTVFAAEHVLIGRLAAIKLLHASLSSAPVLVSRFLAEARAVCRLRHPNVVEVTDFGLLTTGQPYLVMERLTGLDLARRLEVDRVLQPVVVLRIAREIARALEAAHAEGIVHNDLKPENVVLLEGSTDEAPRLKVIDFGASSLAERQEDERGVLYGTPEYVAPERARGAPADGRADLYSLGVILYEMLTGGFPISGATPGETLLAQLTSTPPAPASPLGPLPLGVTQLVGRALRKSPDERQQSASELLAEVERALEDLARDGWRRWLPSLP